MLPQELNLQCGESYTPITHANARRIGTFINCFTDMTNAQFVKHDFDTRECPYCQAPTDEVRYDPYGYWKTVRGQLPGHEFLLYGGGNEGEASELLSEGEIPGKVRDTSLNLHMKLHEGWGHSLLQTVYAGRPALVPQSFYAFRTAGRYLIPGETCFEFDLNSPESCAGLIRELTSDIPWLDRVGRRCYDIAQTLFDWDFHAEKLNRWLHDLQ
jgi:glycosyltransferase involved in cell wall biosynthesis